MSTVSEIREAIRNLPAKEAWQLAAELRDHLDALWDEQFERDVEEGRLDQLIARAREEHASGRTRSMDEIVGDKWVLAALSLITGSGKKGDAANLSGLEYERVLKR